MNRSNRIAEFLMAALTFSCATDVLANNISFEQASYSGAAGTELSVTLTYDFTAYNMFGGGLNLIYDPTAIQFVSYTQAEYAGGFIGPEPAASAVGELASPGNYLGMSLGTFDHAFGISDSGDIGTFVFVLLGNGVSTTPCGATMCLTPVAINPFVSLSGQDVSDQIFSNGVSAANIQTVPLPASFWFLASALSIGFARLKNGTSGLRRPK